MWVGQIQLVITNEGKRVDMEDLDATPRQGANDGPSDFMRSSPNTRKRQTGGIIGQGTDLSAKKPTKKIRSRPIDQPATSGEQQTQMETMLKQIGTQFDYRGEQASVLAADSELARKRLRVARMKKQVAATDLSQG